MIGWILKISIISILLIMILHYSQFCFAQDLFPKSCKTGDDLKVQKYKNIITALSKKKEDDPIEDMSSDLLEYLNNKQSHEIEHVIIDDVINTLPLGSSPLQLVSVPLGSVPLESSLIEPSLIESSLLEPIQIDITEIVPTS
jgi:hypothetical protein